MWLTATPPSRAGVEVLCGRGRVTIRQGRNGHVVLDEEESRELAQLLVERLTNE